MFINRQGERRQQPERQATGHAKAQWTAQTRATPAAIQRGEQNDHDPRPGEETAIAQVDDLPRIVAIVHPIGRHETDSGCQHAHQKQAEQHRLRVFTTTLGDPPADKSGQRQRTDQQQVIERDGKGAEGESQH
ncbi:hypothetical protein D3C72_1692320 [compost metagenome]